MNRNFLAAHVCGRALLLSETGVLSLQALIAEPAESPGILSGLLRSLTGERRSPAARSDQVPQIPGAGDAGGAPSAFWRGTPYLERAAITPGEGDYCVAEGVAMIDVAGVLLDRAGFAWCQPEIFAYDELELAVAAASADSAVSAIMLRIDSPGGMTDGLFACAETIFEASARSGGKPIHAFVAATACSAAYVLAAACDRIVAARGAIVASLGAIMVHAETSAAARAAGYKITAIRSRDHKQAANAFEPLTAEAHAELQGIIDSLDARLVEDLARYRPSLSTATIDALAGRMFIADSSEAITQGLIDSYAREREAFAALSEIAASGDPASLAIPVADPRIANAIANPKPAGKTAGVPSNQENNTMNREQMIAALGLTDAEAKALSTAELIAKLRETLDEVEAGASDDDADADGDDDADAAADDAEADGDDDADADDNGDADDDDADAKAKAKARASAGERRVLAILDLPEAKGREDLAKSLARAGLSVKNAKASLAAAPQAVSGFPGIVPDPKLAADAGDADAGKTEAQKLAGRALAAAGLS